MLSMEEINKLGESINNTWGKGGDGTRSVSCDLSDDKMIIKFMTVVHFASEDALSQQTKKLTDESNQIIDDKIKSMKKLFKESTGNALKLKKLDDNEFIELISTSPYTPRKIAYFRRVCNMQIQN